MQRTCRISQIPTRRQQLFCFRRVTAFSSMQFPPLSSCPSLLISPFPQPASSSPRCFPTSLPGSPAITPFPGTNGFASLLSSPPGSPPTNPSSPRCSSTTSPRTPPFHSFHDSSESKRNSSNENARHASYSKYQIRFIKGSNSPFVDAHNICIDSSRVWSFFFEGGGFRYRYPSKQSSLPRGCDTQASAGNTNSMWCIKRFQTRPRGSKTDTFSCLSRTYLDTSDTSLSPLTRRC